MPRQRDNAGLLETIAALPEETGWRLTRELDIDPGCSLLGGLAITTSQVEMLNALRAGFAGASMWVRLAAAIPPVAVENDHDQFI